ncbi:GPAT4 acyltransferase, partial [Polypterus senegalus]
MWSFPYPFDNLICTLLGISFTVWFTLLLVFIIVPAIFGVSFGIRKLYMKTLLKIFEWATLRIQRGIIEKNHHLYKPYTNGIIAKEPTSLEEEIKEIRRSGSNKDLGSPEFEMSDIFYFCRKGVETIMDDEVTKRFSAEELESWNLLTRSNYNFQYISLRLTVLWGLGVLIRYGFLLPLRVTLAFTGVGLLVVGTTIVGFLPSGRVKDFLSSQVHLMCYRICVRALTAIITYHDRENRPKNGGICVANHTSPIDVIILASDGCYAMYDPRFGDAFWNSSKFGMVNYLLRMMSSWAIVCSVWYLPPMVREEGEDAVQFANRVKSAIAHQGGLVDLLWDGGLKRAKVKDTFKEEQQKLYSKMLVGNQADRSRS